MKTRTGGFPIGFRLIWGAEWQKDPDKLITWAKEKGFGALDVPANVALATKVAQAGLRLGSVDLAEKKLMISPDKAKRADAVARNAEHIKACAALGPVNFFTGMSPENPDAPRKENFAHMAAAYSALAPTLEQYNGRVVIEGYPAPGALCCTPETYRALFKECPSKAIGVNYDPSHLIRMGIDPIRFLSEFGERVYHVHGKDTELLPERLYEYGTFQPLTFGERIKFGDTYWRYTIPGHGQMRWGEAFRILKEFGYTGCVSIELEDANFNGTEDGERTGLIQAGHFLQGC